MGQTIEISNVDVVGDVAVFTANRSLGGQDGEPFAGPVETPTTYPGRLANRLYEIIEGRLSCMRPNVSDPVGFPLHRPQV